MFSGCSHWRQELCHIATRDRKIRHQNRTNRYGIISTRSICMPIIKKDKLTIPVTEDKQEDVVYMDLDSDEDVHQDVHPDNKHIASNIDNTTNFKADSDINFKENLEVQLEFEDQQIELPERYELQSIEDRIIEKVTISENRQIGNIIKFNEIIGQQGLQTCENWLNDIINGKQHTKPICLLYGEPGTGKTSSCYALAQKMNYNVVEINASIDRKYVDVRDKLMKVGIQNTFFSNRMILFDELDGAYEQGTQKALAEFLQHNQNVHKVPIMCTANNQNASSFRAIKKYMLCVNYHRLYSNDMDKLCMYQMKKLNLHIDINERASLVGLARGDVRQLYQNLQLQALKTTTSINNTSRRDIANNVFEVVKRVLTHDDNSIDAEHLGSNLNYSIGLIQSNTIDLLQWRDTLELEPYPSTDGYRKKCFGPIEDLADAMSTLDLFNNWHTDVDISTTYLHTLCKTWANNSLVSNPVGMINPPHKTYFRPMSQKICNKRYNWTNYETDPVQLHILEAHYINDMKLKEKSKVKPILKTRKPVKSKK